MKNILKILYESEVCPLDTTSAQWVRAYNEESDLENLMCELIEGDERLSKVFFRYQRARRSLEELTGEEQFARGAKVGAKLFLSLRKG